MTGWNPGTYRCDEPGGVEHGVVIVGYDDSNGYWIVRNSWGPDWGEGSNGYFKVGYGECRIETYIWSVNGVNPP